MFVFDTKNRGSTPFNSKLKIEIIMISLEFTNNLNNYLNIQFNPVFETALQR